MVKTRSQTSSSAIKQEEDCKDTLFLNSGRKITQNRNKLTKRKTSKSNNKRVYVAEVKLEDETDNKPLLQAPSNSRKRKPVTEAQFKQFISYINNDKMPISAASKKVNISKNTGYIYYRRYKKDPKQNLLESIQARKAYTYQDIKTLIEHIVDGGMSVAAASLKANMSSTAGYKYYAKYSHDPNFNTPTSCNRQRINRRCTQDQIKRLIDYIAKDKMPIHVASIKTNMSAQTGGKYYRQHLMNTNHEIPTLLMNYGKRFTQDQIKDVIGYIVNEGMSIGAASIKSKMSVSTARRYYYQYLNDPKHEIPTLLMNYGKRFTQDEIKEFIGYIVNEGMSIRAASIKSKMGLSTARKYYHQYLNDPKHEIPIVSNDYSKRCTQDKIKEIIGCIVNGNMSISESAVKAKVTVDTVKKYYSKYLNDPNYKKTITKKM